MKLIKLAILIIISSIHFSIAQTQFIDFYGTRITIGMKKYTVTNLFKDNYKIEERNNFLMIHDKEDDLIVCSMGFENDKLYVANRYWGIYHYQNSMEFTEVLYTLLSKIQREGLEIAEVSTNIQNEPNAIIKTISIDFGDKEISITINDTEEFDGVEIIERLFRYPQ